MSETKEQLRAWLQTRPDIVARINAMQPVDAYIMGAYDADMPTGPNTRVVHAGRSTMNTIGGGSGPAAMKSVSRVCGELIARIHISLLNGEPESRQRALIDEMAALLNAEETRVLATMPTGPWVEGDAPEEDGGYLCVDREGLFFVDTWEKGYGWFSPGFVLRHAKIKEVEE